MRFNEKNTLAKSISSRSDATTNFEGGIAFKVEPKMELFLRSASAMVGQPKFYTSGAMSDEDIAGLVRRVGEQDPEFVFKLALYAREQLYLRSLPIMLVVELLNHVKDIPNSQNWVESIIQRPDEITEMISYQFAFNAANGKNEKHIPAAMKLGIARAFGKFDEYQFSKYNGEGNQIKMRDAMFITHPVPKTREQIELYKRIADSTLNPAKIWETSIMVKGATKESWENILPSMGYMAILRNVRNFIQRGVDTSLYVPRLYDRDFVIKSKQFPFRFFSAWKAVKYMPTQDVTNVEDIPVVMKGIERALNESVANVPSMSGITFVASDVSGSMESPIVDVTLLRKRKSKKKIDTRTLVTRKEIATLFGAIVSKKSDKSIASVFGSDFKVVNMYHDSIIENGKMAHDTRVGHSTNAWKAISYLNEEKKVVDRIVVFSDEVVYDSNRRLYGSNSLPLRWFGDNRDAENRSFVEELVKYQRNVNPDVFIYSVDLAGYGFSSIPINTKNSVKLAGFSDKIFQYISLFERDKQTMMDDIEQYHYH